MKSRTRVTPVLLAAALILAWPALVAGQQVPAYRIGPEDILTISFWQRPALNVTAQVRQDGRIAVPIIGETEVAGLTAQEVTDRIVDRISRYDREISQALVQVIAYNARRVFVTGQVGAPGKYGYEVVPDLWTVMRHAGGPLETADLSRVRVISPSGAMQIVDLAQILHDRRVDSLPPLEAGTTVDVPRRAEYLPVETYRELRDLQPVVYVTGSVIAPGPKPLEGDVYVYDALALAGGFGADADLERVQVISKAPGGPVAQTLDLRPETRDRAALNYRIRYEDMIIVQRRGGGFFGTFRDVVTLATAVTSIVLIVDRFSGP